MGLCNMSLRLSLIKAPEGISPSYKNHTFNQSGGTLGRADTNTWVLPDPDKFLSSCHCEITFAENQFFILDRSTNGTFINGSMEPIGRGSRMALNNGDFIDLGDYRFSVSLENPHTPAFESSSPFDFPAANTDGDSFFSKITHSIDAPAQNASPYFFEQQQNDPLALWDEQTAQSPFGSISAQPSNSPFARQDLVNAPEANNKSLDDFLGCTPATAAVPAPFTAVDLSPSLDQAIDWPSSTQESVIPEDWAEDLLAAQPTTSISSSHVTQGIWPQETKNQTAFTQSSAPKNENPQKQPTPGLKERVPLAERLAAIEVMQNQLLRNPNVPMPTPAPHHGNAPSEASSAPHSTMPGSSRLIDALGLDKSRLTTSDIAEIEELSGKLLREIVDGMLGVLRSRANIKNEFRMNVTTIQPVENNPLKFSVNVDDALENLFLKKSNAFKRPTQAFREGFQEIAEHQLAMIAGIRAGFDSIIDRFDPEPLAASFAKQTKSGLLPGMQKTKYWNCYQDYYQSLTDNMDHSFQHLFGSQFVTAYEDQLRRLVASRTKDNPHE